ncbi:TATA box-binding protein-associated factor RNA polymerase I subunit B isoform X2 [Rousettus aegyptiacus]|uniref:TATA box-binding protein-associated factor RNA polymerase I subunit B n=1 Tax=Rousettus aegyptiacus TaxID=9407 RepID=A0A7J8FNM9_ROUAE|nr:TATA box-binding protein-associated factor RNA polymerase I subunit B isoform X2 [Rousettus aegyptiacus]KAF6449059.1 TATA-box binding protein associated factor, RNA polymerase I subunit B [Rousettus aegyptiacus]
MDLEEAEEFRERCTQCAAVSWGLTDEGKYYCTSCHNVTERSKEVISTEAIPNTKIQAINRGLKRKRKLEKGWDWYVCEGFQHILYQQAEALKTLGVGPELKNEVLHNFWKRYLQKSKQAYCKNPVYTSRRKATVLEDNSSHSEWDSEPELLSDFSCFSFVESGTESQPDVHTRKPFPINKASQSETASVCSGSLDGVEYSLRKQKGVVKMTMPRTLAFCSLSLLWRRETITLSDLLRFVEEDHIPYINAFQHFPEEMKLYGRDKGIFAIESWPDYEDIYKKMIEVATFLDLPRFPDITEDCYLHPDILCMKYLMEVNLPDEMHSFTCQVVKMAGIGEVDFLTFDPVAKMAKTVKYDVQAVAVIVIVLKLLFLLDDNLEWSLSTIAEKHNEENKEDKPWFDFRKWYQVMKKSFDEKKQKWEEARAKFVWKSEKPLYHSAIDRSVAYKRREMVVNLQKQFSTLVDSTPTGEKKNPSSFQFNWTEEDTGRTCFHGHSLQGILTKKGQSLTTKNSLYWLSTQKFCKSYCKHVTTYEESNFSLSYQFILNLFSFLLRIKTSFLHEEVSLIEKRLFKTKYSKTKKKSSRSRKVRK